MTRHIPALAPYVALLPFALADVPLPLVLPLYALSAMVCLVVLSAIVGGRNGQDLPRHSPRQMASVL